MYTFNESVLPLLSILRCPVCHSTDQLEVKSGLPEKGITNVILHDQYLFCEHCKTQYPITDDFIPVMWDADVQDILAASDSSESTSLTTIGANLAIYQDISDNYDLYTRRDTRVMTRLQNAALKIFPELKTSRINNAKQYHLDFGCGPGHVLGWLKEFGFTQIGLDISLNNLRNARKHTGCFVICGSACNIPFASETMDLITESSVLHHILDWQHAVSESLRICKKSGGVVLDSEPTTSQLAWSPLAVKVYNSRFRAYQLLSYIRRDRYIFRNIEQAKLNMQAEIHNQPGKGISLDEMRLIFKGSGFDLHIFLSPTPELECHPKPTWKRIILNLLSARNPWNPEYGGFTVIGATLN